MTRVTVTPGFWKYIDGTLREWRNDTANRLAASTLDELLTVTPVQSGHAHEAWLSAARKVLKKLKGDTSDLRAAIDQHEVQGSGDPKAVRAGRGFVRDTKHKTVVRFVNNLGFVRKLEYGGVLTPIAPGGFKKGKHHFPGPLFGKRRPATSRQNEGWLAWRDSNGDVKFAKRSQLRPGGYAATALQNAKRRIQQ